MSKALPRELLVRCENITYKISNNIILDNVSFDIYKGDIITIIGPNGAGKSTLGKIVIGVLNMSEGKVSRKKNLKIGYMPQKIYINKLVPITVKDFLFLNINKNILNKKYTEQIVEENYIHSILNKQVQDISGGEWQRLLLARILLRDPDLLVLDEPIQGLDINGQRDFYLLLEQIKNKQKKSILMISHDLHTVMSSSNNIICLNKHICCSGAPKEIEDSSSYKNLFKLGGSTILARYTHDHKHKSKPKRKK